MGLFMPTRYEGVGRTGQMWGRLCGLLLTAVGWGSLEGCCSEWNRVSGSDGAHDFRDIWTNQPVSLYKNTVHLASRRWDGV